MQGVHSPLHFARYEFKYILPLSQSQEIERDLQHFLQYDPFVLDKLNYQYQVRSLYFDDPSYSAFYDKIDGLHSRYKYRLRTYSVNETDKTSIFLEMKGRHNNLVYKHRIPIVLDDSSWADLSGELLIANVLSNRQTSPVLEQFAFDRERKCLQGIALIDYQRRPYLSKFDEAFRLTFDANLQVTQADSLFPCQSVSSGRKILPGYVILEVKFKHHMPAWFHTIIQAYELQRVSISKICAGMECLGLAEDY